MIAIIIIIGIGTIVLVISAIILIVLSFYVLWQEHKLDKQVKEWRKRK